MIHRSRRPAYNNFGVQQVTLLLLQVVVFLFITENNIAPILGWTGNIKSLSNNNNPSTSTSTTTIVTWLIDGTNLGCSRSVPNQRETIIHELQKIASLEDNKEIILRNDDEYDNSNSSNNDDGFRAIYTDTINNTRRTRKTKMTNTITNVVLIFDGNEDENFTDDDNSSTSEGKAKILFEQKWFQCIITDGTNKVKDRADDYIVDYVIPSLLKLEQQKEEKIVPTTSKSATIPTTTISKNNTDTSRIIELTETTNVNTINTKVHLVTADQELQKRVRATRIMKSGSCIHPPKFWKEYLPILQQQQQEQQQQEQQQQQQQQEQQQLLTTTIPTTPTATAMT